MILKIVVGEDFENWEMADSKRRFPMKHHGQIVSLIMSIVMVSAFDMDFR